MLTLKKEQERYEVLKTDANSRLDEVKKAGEAKILKLELC